MIKVAMIAESGEVQYTVSPAVDDMYLNGQVYNGLTAKHISHTADDREVVETWYWDDGWKTRDARPTPHHDWIDGAWKLSADRFWQSVRQDRFYKLCECDWTQLPDTQLTDAKKVEWAAYRQALRDLPASYQDETSTHNVVYPTKPEA